jgi:hypothetical protein
MKTFRQFELSEQSTDKASIVWDATKLSLEKIRAMVYDEFGSDDVVVASAAPLLKIIFTDQSVHKNLVLRAHDTLVLKDGKLTQIKGPMW